jgi:hypothetical protein
MLTPAPQMSWDIIVDADFLPNKAAIISSAMKDILYVTTHSDGILYWYILTKRKPKTLPSNHTRISGLQTWGLF